MSRSFCLLLSAILFFPAPLIILCLGHGGSGEPEALPGLQPPIPEILEHQDSDDSLVIVLRQSGAFMTRKLFSASCRLTHQRRNSHVSHTAARVFGLYARCYADIRPGGNAC